MKLSTKPVANTESALTSFFGDNALANQWAIQTIVSWLRSKPADLLEQQVASSFPGIRETLVHIWDTERFWLSVIKQQPAPESYRVAGFHGTLEEVFAGAQKTSKELSDFVTWLSDEQLCEVVTFDTPWAQGSKTRYEFIQHCINHSSYHRGQVVTIGHHLGFHDAPMTDFSFYLLMIKQ